MMKSLKTIIDTAFEQRDTLNFKSIDAPLQAAVLDVINALDAGHLKVVEKKKYSLENE